MASLLNQDQNLSVHFDGVKINGSIAQKNKGGLGGRKALNDISNSGKPSALQPSRKHNMKNVIPIGEEESVVSKKAAKPVSGRKALGDVTNSAIPSSQKQELKKTSRQKQAFAFADEEKFLESIAEEGFLHNHDECIKQQKKSMEMDYNEFLRIVGLDQDGSFESPKKSMDENFMMIYDEMEDVIIEDPPTPIRGRPDSPELPLIDDDYFRDYDDFHTFNFALIESPERLK